MVFDEHNIDVTNDSEVFISDTDIQAMPSDGEIGETKNLSKIDVARLLLDRAINRSAYYADLVTALKNYIDFLHKDN